MNDKEKPCKHYAQFVRRVSKYNGLFCKKCDTWLNTKCLDEWECPFCDCRPDKPSDDKDMYTETI